MLTILEGIVMLVREVQFAKAPKPISVKVLGSKTLTNAFAFWNTRFSMTFTPSSIVILVKPLRFPKNLTGILSALPFTITEVILLQPVNVTFVGSTSVIFPSRVTLVRPVQLAKT